MQDTFFQLSFYELYKKNFYDATQMQADDNKAMYLSYLSCIFSQEVLKELKDIKGKISN